MSTRPQTPAFGAAQLAHKVRLKIKRERAKLPKAEAGEFRPKDRFVQGQLHMLEVFDVFTKNWDKRDKAHEGGQIEKRVKKPQAPPDKSPWD